MILSLSPDIYVIGEGGTRSEAMQLALDMQPDLILLDLLLPDINIATLFSELRKLSPASKIVALTALQSPVKVRQALDAGIHGYIIKEATPEELIEAVRETIGGGKYIHPKLSALLAATEGGSFANSPLISDSHLPQLTKREHDVLFLLTCTSTNREIAEHLALSEETVRTHIKGILRKLDQPSRTQAVIHAIRLGLLEI